jgi:HSP20 family molecular chaperone IbpA
MTNLTRWRWRSGALDALRRDIDDILEAFEPPRGFRRELDRLVGAELAPRTLWRELDSLLADFGSPAPLRHRLERRLLSDMVAPAPMRQRLWRFIDRATNLFRRGGDTFYGHDMELLAEERDDAYVIRLELPQDVDASKIDADLRRGVLEVHVPKLSIRSRQIPISRGESLRERDRGDVRVMAHRNGGLRGEALS